MVKPVTRFDVLDALGLSAMAKEHGGEVVLSQRVAEELARTWLAVDGAPMAVVATVQADRSGTWCEAEFIGDAKGIAYGQRVKLVLVPEADSGGDRG